MTDRLPELLDAKALRLELGVTRAAAEAIMRQLPTVEIEGLRKVYVRREDVRRYLDASTFGKDQVPVSSTVPGRVSVGSLNKTPPAPRPGSYRAASRESQGLGREP